MHQDAASLVFLGGCSSAPILIIFSSSYLRGFYMGRMGGSEG